MVDALIVEIKSLFDGQPVSPSTQDRHELAFGPGCDLCKSGVVMLPLGGVMKVVTCECLSGRTRAQHIGLGSTGKPVCSLIDRPDLKDLAIRERNELETRLESASVRFGVDIFADEETQLNQWRDRFRS